MKFIKSLFISSILLTLISIVGCNEVPTTSSVIPDADQKLTKTATSATLHIYNHFANEQTVNIYAVSSDWVECDVTWSTQPSVFEPAEFSFVTNVGNDWITKDITSLVNKWLDGTYDNYGILLYSTGTNLERFDSREGVNKPFVRIVYSDGSEDVICIADVELNELKPDLNICDDVYLFNGIVNGYEKKALLKFDIEYTPEVECETAFAFDDDTHPNVVGKCFTELGFGNWGWSIYLPGTGSYTFPVYAGAGQCDITKGTYVGDVTVVYAENGSVTFTYDFEPGFSTDETHFYAGKTEVPVVRGKPTVAPGQYYITPNLSGPIYIIAHAVVCSSDWD